LGNGLSTLTAYKSNSAGQCVLRSFPRLHHHIEATAARILLPLIPRNQYRLQSDRVEMRLQTLLPGLRLQLRALRLRPSVLAAAL
jgi:hypothetical protein